MEKAIEIAQDPLYCTNIVESILAAGRISDARQKMDDCLDSFNTRGEKSLSDDIKALELIFSEGGGDKLPDTAKLRAVADKFIAEKETRRAIPLLVAAVLADPADAESFFRLAQCYRKTGDLRLAAKYFHRYLYLKPSGKHAAKVKSEIEKLEST